MGIKSGFNRFLKETCPEVFEEIHISEYAFKRIAIDISLYMHKYKAIFGDGWISAFINLVSCLRKNEVHCVFIFDGDAPPEKETERAKRRDTRDKLEQNLHELENSLDEYYKTGILDSCLVNLYEKRRSPHVRLVGGKKEVTDIKWVEQKIEQRRNQLYKVDSDDYELVRKLFKILGVPFYKSTEEAEKLCSKLCLDGKIDAVLSEDTDVFAYGSPVFLTHFDTNRSTCLRVKFNELLASIKLDKNQFLDLCIMCGTDYNPNIPRVGSKTAYKYILEYENLDRLSSETKLDTSVLNYTRVRQLFSEFSDYDINSIPYCGNPDFEELDKFIKEHSIKIDMEKIINSFTKNMILFVDDE